MHNVPTVLRFRPFRVAALAVLLALPSVSPGQPAPAGPVPSAARWGVVDDHIATSELALQKVRDAGFGWVRYLVFWNLVNPYDGTYDWALVDQELARIEAAGLNAYFQIAAPPPWALSGTPVSYPPELALYFCLDHNAVAGTTDPYKRIPDCEDDHHPRPDAVASFASALAARYKGRVRAYGFGVERHSRVFWQGDTNGEISRDQFVNDLLRPAYQAVKAVDPDALLVGPDVDRTDELAALLSRERDGRLAGRGPAIDVIAFHTFHHGTWYAPDAFENGISGDPSLAPLRDVITQYGLGRPLWLTEMGYWVRNGLTRDQQATWLDQFMRGITVRPWIDKAFVYRMLNDSESDFGLLNRDGETSATPAMTMVTSFLGSVALPKFYFLAEGAAGTFFDMDIAIANPNQSSVPIKASFLKKDGTVLTKAPTLAPQSRTTIRYEADVDPSPFSEVSTVVESTTGAPIAVERTLFWNDDYYAGHTGSAVAAPARTWYFGEGFQGSFDTFVLLANATTADASVTVTFLRETGTPIDYRVDVPPNSRQTVWAIQVLENGIPALDGQSFAIRVESDVPIIAERSMYFNAGGLFWGAGHESAGVSDLSTTWFLAEGNTGPLFDTYVLVGNPGTQDAEITFTFLIGEPGVPPVVATTTVAAAKRFTLDAENAHANLASNGGALAVISGDINILRNAPFSTKVESTNGVPIVVERAMYWPGGFSTWAEAHNSFGVTSTGLKWGLAEGRSGRGRGFETYILIANPSLQAAMVTVTFLRPTDTPVVKTYTIDPTSRFNIAVPANVAELPDDEFSAIIESTNGIEIVVERAMYWNGPGSSFWAGGTNATAVRLQ